MGIIFQDGFESGDFSAWSGTTVTGTGAAATVSGTAAQAGSYGLLSNGTTGGQNWNAYAHYSFAAPSSGLFHLQFRMNLATINTDGYLRFCRLNSATHFNLFRITRSSSPTWRAHIKGRDGVEVAVTITGGIPASQWVKVDVLLDTTGADNVWKLWVDDVLKFTHTDSTSGTEETPNVLQIGLSEDQWSATGTCYFDVVNTWDDAANIPGAGSAARAGSSLIQPATIQPPAPALDDVIVAVPRAAAQPATRAPRVILADAPAWNPATAAGAQWAQIIGRQNRPALRRNGARFIQADTPRITSPALDDFIVPVPKGASGAPATRRGAMPVVADAPPSQQPAPESVIVAVPRAAAAQPVMKAGVAPIIADTPQALQAAFDGLIVSVPRSPAMVPPTRAGASPLVADAPPVALPAMDAQIIRILRATYIAPALIQAWAPVVGQAGATDAILIVVPRVGAIAVRAPGLVLADVLRAPSAGGEAMLIVVPRDAGAVPQIRFLGGLRARRDGTLSARDASLRARNIGE